MYLEKFKLAEMPFKITPDPRFLFLTPQHQDVLERGEYVINEHGGLMVIYGDIGMGKTTVARRLYEIINDTPNCQAAMLVTPALKTETAFLRAIMEEFDVSPKRSYATSLAAFQDYMFEANGKGSNLAIIIDEAQKLTPRMLDVLHTLLNFESNTEKFLQIVLIGQRELADNIDRVPAIKSRVAIFGSLSPLTQADTNDMVAFRWHTASAGKSTHPFSTKALETIYMLSHGLPREINKLCHESLINAAIGDADEVSAEMVIDAAKELRLTKEEVPA